MRSSVDYFFYVVNAHQKWLYQTKFGWNIQSFALYIDSGQTKVTG